MKSTRALASTSKRGPSQRPRRKKRIGGQKIHGHRTKNGKRRESITYTSWRAMVQRCTNPNHYLYERYGGAGIVVAERWRVFANFLSDMGRRPSKKYTIGRIAPFADYGPGECEWQTAKQQNKGLNDRSGRLKEVDGVTKTNAEWAKHLGISYRTLLTRIRNGWRDDAYRIRKGGRRPRP